MSVILCGKSAANRGVASVPVGRKWAVIASAFDIWISISANPAGDAVAGNCGFAWARAGVAYIGYTPIGYPPQFISGMTTDPNGDANPTTLTFIDSGASPF